MDGEFIPCSSEEVTLEIIGDAIDMLDEQTIKHASAGVLHYFKAELGKTTVTIPEFSAALEHALRAIGLKVQSDPVKTAPGLALFGRTSRAWRADLIKAWNCCFLALAQRLAGASRTISGHSPLPRFARLRQAIAWREALD